MPLLATLPVLPMIPAPVIPDWNKTHVTVVDPTIWQFYRKGIHDLRSVYRQLLNAFLNLGVSYDVLTKEHRPIDIWITDWGPVNGYYLIYHPSYAPGWYSEQSINTARRHLDALHHLRRRSIPIVLDGGNLVQNGKTAIVTEKVLRDNPHLSTREIHSWLRQLGFDDIVIIPIEPNDPLGHADGILRFVGPQLLLINNYERLDAFRSYGRRLRKQLERQLPDIHLISLPWFPTNRKMAGVWSARGTYINVVQTKNCLLYPSFDSPFDEEVAAIFRRIVRTPQRAIAANALAQLGGVLNCIVLTP